jgi:choline dehydrogenase-like flavoprotein
MIKFSNPGSGTHCGSSFPMRRIPSGPFDSDVLGRPFGWSRVFIVDSSVLPSIPGTTLALAAMANADRIASTAPLGVGNSR